MNNSCLIYGSGRWASQYIKALELLYPKVQQIYHIGSQLPHYRPKDLIHFNSIEDFNSGYLTSKCSHSIIASTNRKHQGHILQCLPNMFNILCEKPLCISPSLWNECRSYSTDYSLKFWESLIPLYANYLHQLRPYVLPSSSLQLVWQDSLKSVERHGSIKQHDRSLAYFDDVLPNIISTLSSIGVCSNERPLSLSNINEYDLDSGNFQLTGNSFKINVAYSRKSPSRSRIIKFSNGEDFFVFDYTREPGTIVSASSYLKRGLFSNLCFESPLLAQTFDFMHSNSSRNLFSTSWCLLTNFSPSPNSNI